MFSKFVFFYGWLISCMLSGKLVLFKLVGIDILGRLVRFSVMVNMLFRYIWIGLLFLILLMLNVVDGVVGVRIVFILLVNMFLKLCLIRLWILWVWL